MNLRILKPGHKVRMRNGALGRVVAETGDGARIEIEYLEPGGNSPPIGTRESVDGQEVEALLGVVHPNTWGGEVTVVLHHIPESEDSEAGFEAVTMKGVPYGVIITGDDPDSAENALVRLVDGLQAFGFAGRVVVEDATSPGRPERYELRTD